MTINDFYETNSSLLSAETLALFDWLPDLQTIIDKTIKDNFGTRETMIENSIAITEQTYIRLASDKYRYDTLYGTTIASYNAIENYDRTETTTVEKNASTEHGTQTETVESATGSQTNTVTDQGNISPFDTETNINTVGNTNSAVNGARNDTSNLSRNSYTDTELVADTTTSHIHGNIGVTTTQQMLQSEREISNFSMVKILAYDIVDAISYSVYF